MRRCKLPDRRNPRTSETIEWRNHIVVDPGILLGKPIVKGTRVSVEFLLDRFADGWGYGNILAAYPHLTREQVQAAAAFAAELFKGQRSVAIKKATA